MHTARLLLWQRHEGYRKTHWNFELGQINMTVQYKGILIIGIIEQSYIKSFLNAKYYFTIATSVGNSDFFAHLQIVHPRVKNQKGDEKGCLYTI